MAIGLWMASDMLEKRQHLNAEGMLSGEMSIEFDVATGRISAVGSGYASYPQVVAFFDDWRSIIGRIHAAGRPVSALVDMTGGAVQRGEVADLIAARTNGLYREGDAVAMLVWSSLAKLQMRRVLDSRFHDFFVSHGAATTWLGARAASLGGDPADWQRSA